MRGDSRSLVLDQNACPVSCLGDKICLQPLEIRCRFGLVHLPVRIAALGTMKPRDRKMERRKTLVDIIKPAAGHERQGTAKLFRESIEICRKRRWNSDGVRRLRNVEQSAVDVEEEAQPFGSSERAARIKSSLKPIRFRGAERLLVIRHQALSMSALPSGNPNFPSRNAAKLRYWPSKAARMSTRSACAAAVRPAGRSCRRGCRRRRCPSQAIEMRTAVRAEVLLAGGAAIAVLDVSFGRTAEKPEVLLPGCRADAVGCPRQPLTVGAMADADALRIDLGLISDCAAMASSGNAHSCLIPPSAPPDAHDRRL